MNSQTSPHDNISPADTPPRPSRARPRPQLIWEHGASPKWLSLPPFTKKNNPFPIDAACCEDYPQDPTSPHDNISAAAAVATTIPLTAVNLINNQQMTGSGGAGGLRGDDTMRDKACTQQSNISCGGGVVDNNDDDDGHDNNDNNDNDGGCGGRDGHHRMRKGRGHNDRANTTIK